MFYLNFNKLLNYLTLVFLSIMLYIIVRFYFLVDQISLYYCSSLNFFTFIFSLDYINYFFILLLVIVFIISYFSYLLDFKSVDVFFLLSFIITFLSLMFSFLSYDIFTFYIFFEVTFFQFSLYLLKYGQSVRKQKSFLFFLIYSLLGSLFFFISIFVIYFNYGLHIIYSTSLTK